MAGRFVKKTHKDKYGDILALCGDNADSWSPRKITDVINDIERGFHTYYVTLPGVGKTKIHVADGPTGKYLRTDHDSTTHNNLNDLPDC